MLSDKASANSLSSCQEEGRPAPHMHRVRQLPLPLQARDFINTVPGVLGLRCS